MRSLIVALSIVVPQAAYAQVIPPPVPPDLEVPAGNTAFRIDVPQVWRRALRGPQSEVLVTTFPKATHWGGDWTVGTRGLYYLNELVPDTVRIDFLAFGAIAARPIRVTSLSAPPSRGVSVFDVAPDESWLVWAQDDYRNSDIMLIPHR
jgi:hypothetical protein